MATDRLIPITTVEDACGFWLAKIANETIRDLAAAFLRRAHPRFFTAPSSATGAYHPPDEFFAGPQGDATQAPAKGKHWGGQVLHVARVCYLTLLIADCWDCSPLERELALAGALTHDIGRYIDGKTATDPQHDSTVAALTADLATDPRFRYYYPRLVAISEAHAGRYGIRMPQDAVERAVATADYLASRPGFGGFDPYPKVVDY
jgi:hypothetical protein